MALGCHRSRQVSLCYTGSVIQAHSYSRASERDTHRHVSNGVSGSSGGARMSAHRQASGGCALTGLARALAQADRLPAARRRGALPASARQARRSFVEQLVASGRISAAELAEFASHTFGLPLLDLDAIDPERIPLALVDRKLIETRRVLPLRKRGNKLALAVSRSRRTRKPSTR